MSKKKITDLKFDDKNFNKGTQYGKHLMEKSLSKFGAGRSILIDKNNRIIAGNKTTENFGELGLEDVKIVETDGKTLIAVKRNDIDLDTPEGREFALADNQTAKTNIDFDFDYLESELGEDTMEEWGLTIEEEVDKMEDGDEIEIPQSVQLKPPMEYILIMADPNSIEWEDLKETLKLKMVRRGGYKKGSGFDAVSLERVIDWKDFKSRVLC